MQNLPTFDEFLNESKGERKILPYIMVINGIKINITEEQAEQVKAQYAKEKKSMAGVELRPLKKGEENEFNDVGDADKIIKRGYA